MALGGHAGAWWHQLVRAAHWTSTDEVHAHWGAAEGTEEGDKLDVLLAPVDLYEAKRWPIEAGKNFDPVDVLNYVIDELGHTQVELAELLGSRSRASEILYAGARSRST